MIIYFFLHPSLGKKDLEQSAGLFRVNPCTLERWLTKNDMKKKRASMVNHLKFYDVVRAIPNLSIKERLQKLQIPTKVKKLTVSIKGSFNFLTRNSSCSKSHQRIIAIANADKTLYVKSSAKRIKQQAQTTKHLEVQEFIRDTIVTRWNIGLPITNDELRRRVVAKSKKQKNWEAWTEIYAKGTRKSTKKLTVFLH